MCKVNPVFDRMLVFILVIVQNCAGSSKLCEKCEKRLVVRICAGNSLKCKYVREAAKSAISHPPHLIVAFAAIKLISCQGNEFCIIEFCNDEFLEWKWDRDAEVFDSRSRRSSAHVKHFNVHHIYRSGGNFSNTLKYI